MNLIRTTIILSLNIISCLAAYPAAFQSADYFWNSSNGNAITASNWSTNQDSASAPSTIDLSNAVVGRMNGSTSTGILTYFMPGTYTLKGIYNNLTSVYDPNSGDLLTPKAAWEFYNRESNVNLTISDGITNVTGPIMSSTSSSTATGRNAVLVRKRAGYSNFNVTCGELNTLNGSIIYLGASTVGYFLTSLALTGDVNAIGASSTQKSTLYMYASSISLAAGKNINLQNSSLTINKGNGDAAETALAPNVNFSQNTLNLAGGVTFQYGHYQNALDADFSMGDINVSGTSNTLSTHSTRAISLGDINYTAAGAQLVISVSSDVNAGALANSIYGSRLDLQSTRSGTNFNFDSITSTFAAVVAGGNVITENFANNYDPTDQNSLSAFNLQNGTLTINGTFTNNGRILFDGGGANNVSVSMGGLAGGNGLDTHRITTSYSGSNIGTTTLIFTGDGSYESKTRLHDMGYATTSAQITTLGANAALGIIKNGTGTQILRGRNYYRGDTVINSGALYMKADNEGRNVAGAVWGLGRIILNGGTFGAIGKTADYGLVYATNIELKGGRMAFDITSTGNDLIALSDTSAPISATSAEDFKFDFVISDYESGVEYTILTWDSSVTLDYNVEDFVYTVTNNADSADLVATFRYLAGGSSNGLAVSFATVPEPAQVAALFALAALLFARRLRKKS